MEKWRKAQEKQYRNSVRWKPYTDNVVPLGPWSWRYQAAHALLHIAPQLTKIWKEQDARTKAEADLLARARRKQRESALKPERAQANPFALRSAHDID